MNKKPIGIIGGSGLYKMEGVRITSEKLVETPFGSPSDAVMLGTLNGVNIAFLPRHGRGHRFPPHKINYRANIYAMKVLGVERIVSVSAVGSLKENLKPGHLVVVDQFVDRTNDRPQTFFEEGIVVHTSFADPVCPALKAATVEAIRKSGSTVHDGGTYVCIEGPMFSSRAESNIYRQWGVDVVGMTNYQEAKLAREAEICYVTIALVTDYDCWHVEEGPAVDGQMVMKVMQENVARAKAAIHNLLPMLNSIGPCQCRNALKDAIITERSLIPADVKKKLDPIIGKYF